MLMRTGLAALALTLVATMPAHALFCSATRSGLVVQFGVHLGEPYTESERNEFDLMVLRQRGVDAASVERWNGCIRAFVRTGTGEQMQFFDPDTYERLQ